MRHFDALWCDVLCDAPCDEAGGCCNSGASHVKRATSLHTILSLIAEIQADSSAD